MYRCKGVIVVDFSQRRKVWNYRKDKFLLLSEEKVAADSKSSLANGNSVPLSDDGRGGSMRKLFEIPRLLRKLGMTLSPSLSLAGAGGWKKTSSVIRWRLVRALSKVNVPPAATCSACREEIACVRIASLFFILFSFGSLLIFPSP